MENNGLGPFIIFEKSGIGFPHGSGARLDCGPTLQDRASSVILSLGKWAY